MFMYSYYYVYVFLLLSVFCSGYSVSLWRSVYCLCVNAYCTTATNCQPNCSCIYNSWISYCFRPVHCPPNSIWRIDREFFWGFRSSAMWRCVVVVVVSGVSEISAIETSEITDAATRCYFAEDLNSQLYSCDNFKFRSLFTASCLDGAISNWVTRRAWRENLCYFRRVVKYWHLINISLKLWNIWGEKKCMQEFVGEIWRKETTWKTQELMGE